MSAGKQTFAQNPCHFWWKLNPASSSVYLQGLFTHSPEVGDSSLDEVSSTFQPPKLGDGGIRAAPSPSSLCILCCGTTGTDCSMDSKIPHEGRRITAPDPTAVHCKNPVIIPAVLSFLIWKAFKKRPVWESQCFVVIAVQNVEPLLAHRAGATVRSHSSHEIRNNLQNLTASIIFH